MGAVDTMEEFFEQLNNGNREGAVALLDDTAEMRIHVGDSVQTLRGLPDVAPGDVRRRPRPCPRPAARGTR